MVLASQRNPDRSRGLNLLGISSLESLNQAIDAIHSARRVVVLTGAGISAESGVATFRGEKTSLWESFKPEELATPEAFRRNPDVVWRWYMERRRLLGHVSPNAGHIALARRESLLADDRAGFDEFTVITQNIDGLHQRAGSKNVIEIHGSLHRFKCANKGHAAPLELADASPQEPPRCPKCDARIRPDVVWFGEMLPQDALAASLSAIQRADVMLVVGTSGVVFPVAGFAQVAEDSGARVIVVNKDPSAQVAARNFIRLTGSASEVLPVLLAAQSLD
jgi:NAD-dependent deacetylase